MAPAVHLRRNQRLCVDYYKELNTRANKDAYQLSLVYEIQDRLSGSVIFLAS